jgi:hypothetical protein
MIGELLVRFIVGGVIVSAFAALGTAVDPKSFAGIFGAAPSVALATLALAFAKEGRGHAAIEGRSMMAGALALAVYGASARAVATSKRVKLWVGAGVLWIEWLGVALAIWAVLWR